MIPTLVIKGDLMYQNNTKTQDMTFITITKKKETSVVLGAVGTKVIFKSF